MGKYIHFRDKVIKHGFANYTHLHATTLYYLSSEELIKMATDYLIKIYQFDGQGIIELRKDNKDTTDLKLVKTTKYNGFVAYSESHVYFLSRFYAYEESHIQLQSLPLHPDPNTEPYLMEYE